MKAANKKNGFLRKHITTYNSFNFEAKGNTVVFAFLVSALLISILGYILSVAEVFVVNPLAFLICIISSGAATLIITILIIRTKGSILGDSRLKYYQLVVLLLCATIQISMLYYHTTLVLLVPFLLAFCYKSPKFEILTAFLTGTLIIITPYIAYYFGGMDVEFTLWLINITDNEIFGYIRDIVMSKYNLPVELTPAVGLLIFIIVPRLLIASAMVFIMIWNNGIQRKSYEKRIEQIKFMQDNILEGLADVIENRDSETGGHVKRTQQVVKIFVSHMKNTFINRDEQYWENVVKSAAMHDLGKISISDKILNKPGKLTDEEFSLIKLHPVKSAEIIERILRSEENDKLLEVARNMALYHHEKFNGAGYPTGISGLDIPLESRIMAIADVFDALVSKRVYKEPYSYDKAYNIIIESMGSHFDPNLQRVFEVSFPELVKLYDEYAE